MLGAPSRQHRADRGREYEAWLEPACMVYGVCACVRVWCVAHVWLRMLYSASCLHFLIN
jgi:hypothetical protein